MTKAWCQKFCILLASLTLNFCVTILINHLHKSINLISTWIHFRSSYKLKTHRNIQIIHLQTSLKLLKSVAWIHLFLSTQKQSMRPQARHNYLSYFRNKFLPRPDLLSEIWACQPPSHYSEFTTSNRWCWNFSSSPWQDIQDIGFMVPHIKDCLNVMRG